MSTASYEIEGEQLVAANKVTGRVATSSCVKAIGLEISWKAGG